MDIMVNVTDRKFSFLSLVVILLVLGIPSHHADARKQSTFGEEALSNLGHNTNNGERIDISKDKLRSDDFMMFPSGPSTGAPHYEPEPTFTPIEGQGGFGKSGDFGMFPSGPSTGAPHYEPEPTFTPIKGQGEFGKSDDLGMFPSGPSPGTPHYEREPTFIPIEGQGKFEKEP